MILPFPSVLGRIAAGPVFQSTAGVANRLVATRPPPYMDFHPQEFFLGVAAALFRQERNETRHSRVLGS
jgi:hypothetical protein